MGDSGKRYLNLRERFTAVGEGMGKGFEIGTGVLGGGGKGIGVVEGFERREAEGSTEETKGRTGGSGREA